MGTQYLPPCSLVLVLVACGAGASAPDQNSTDSNGVAPVQSSDDGEQTSRTEDTTDGTGADVVAPSNPQAVDDTQPAVDGGPGESQTPPDPPVSSGEGDAGQEAPPDEVVPDEPVAECLSAGTPECSDSRPCCDGTMCITDGVSTVCAGLCTAPTDCVSLCCLPMSDTEAACVPADYCAAPPPPPPAELQSASFDLYDVTQLTRVEQDLYTGYVGGVEIYVVTRYCYEYVYYQDALLSWAGNYSSDSFIIGRGFSSWECEVADVLVP